MIKCSFMDNQEVGADALNGLVKTLIGKPGVADPFTNGEAYYISKLNDICYNNIIQGVLPDTDASLMVSLIGTLASVNAGKAIFDNGMIAEIEGTETVSIVSGVQNYIALCVNTMLNTCSVVSETSKPEDNAENGLYYVLLAEISESHAVIDKRTYAKGRVASTYASNWGLPGYAKLRFEKKSTDFEPLIFTIKAGEYNQMFVYVHEEDEAKSLLKMDLNNFNYFYAYERSVSSTADGTTTGVGREFILCEDTVMGTSNSSYRITATLNIQDGVYILKFDCFCNTNLAWDALFRQTIEIYTV